MKPFYAAVANLAPKLGFKGVRGLAGVLACCMWHLVPSRRKLAIRAIEKHIDVSPEQAARIARSSFTHNFQSFLELFLSGRVDEEFLQRHIRGIPPNGLQQALKYDGPIIGITAHLGAWEFLGGALGNTIRKERKEALVVVRRNKNPDIHELITHFRQIGGTRVVDHRQAVFTVLKVLKKKGLAAFLVDHNCPRNEAIFLPFLNDIAAVNMGPAVLAVRSGAAVLPVFLVRDGQGGYETHVGKMLTPEELTGSRDDKIRQVARFYTQQVEDYVRKYPEQWFWMHKRWKTRPEAGQDNRSASESTREEKLVG
ncbi:lysophospholipid acyltransferase family protein [Desulfovibrio psychrotolerans]|uniref:Acyltransferase n=1 Tax=Desulfovibrio psychrotolerans TaxID=415242 RepID=A0A7J0BQL6_9BACT|nr:lysophospholipid acyltransferase family protein [Desulfovibrio psychrotolerans]GFM35481.1 acyltransferase [Desulfovibrio psychrotolerans]